MNTTTIFKLTNGQTLDYVSSKQIDANTNEITLFKPKRGPYQKKTPDQMKKRGRPFGAKTKKPPHIIDDRFREAVNYLDPEKRSKVVSLFTELGLDYHLDQIVAQPSSITPYQFV